MAKVRIHTKEPGKYIECDVNRDNLTNFLKAAEKLKLDPDVVMQIEAMVRNEMQPLKVN